jgi:hypothetical protein
VTTLLVVNFSSLRGDFLVPIVVTESKDIMPHNFYYSDKYYDDQYEYRWVEPYVGPREIFFSAKFGLPELLCTNAVFFGETRRNSIEVSVWFQAFETFFPSLILLLSISFDNACWPMFK